MRKIDYFQSTKIVFGWGRRAEVGEIVAQYGKRCLLVTEKPFPALEKCFEEIKELCKKSGVEVEHFAGVVPNPTTHSVDKGTEMAVAFNADVVLGVGGGSAIDTAKAIAVGATHEGTAWDYKLYAKEITDKTLPIIAMTTTSGTGSEVTAVSVVTNPDEQLKYALYSHILYPKVGIIDPELTVTVPTHVTAATGFDAFCHSFESFINVGTNPYVDMLALESIKLVHDNLENVLKNPSDKEGREALAWANTLGGLSIANSGTTLPHGMGMAIGGHAPHVSHGEALAIVYPEILKWSWETMIPQCATVARIFDPELVNVSDDKAAEKLSCLIGKFLEKINLRITFSDKKVEEAVLHDINEDIFKLPDYTVHPKKGDKESYFEILKKSL